MENKIAEFQVGQMVSCTILEGFWTVTKAYIVHLPLTPPFFRYELMQGNEREGDIPEVWLSSVKFNRAPLSTVGGNPSIKRFYHTTVEMNHNEVDPPPTAA